MSAKSDHCWLTWIGSIRSPVRLMPLACRKALSQVGTDTLAQARPQLRRRDHLRCLQNSSSQAALCALAIVSSGTGEFIHSIGRERVVGVVVVVDTTMYTYIYIYNPFVLSRSFRTTAFATTFSSLRFVRASAWASPVSLCFTFNGS